MTEHALAPRGAPPSLNRLAFEPSNWAEAANVATALAKSGLLPGQMNEREALAIIVFGRELGFTVWQSLRHINVIDGKPGPDAAGLQAVVMASPLCTYFRCLDHGPKVSTFETLRAGTPEPTRASYTIGEAQLAGLIFKHRSGKPNNWMKYPADMLAARCKARLARLVYPDVAGGLYLPEERVAENDPAPIPMKSTISVPRQTPPSAPHPAEDDGVVYDADTGEIVDGSASSESSANVPLDADDWAAAYPDALPAQDERRGWFAEGLSRLSLFAGAESAKQRYRALELAKGRWSKKRWIEARSDVLALVEEAAAERFIEDPNAAMEDTGAANAT